MFLGQMLSCMLLLKSKIMGDGGALGLGLGVDKGRDLLYRRRFSVQATESFGCLWYACEWEGLP